MDYHEALTRGWSSHPSYMDYYKNKEAMAKVISKEITSEGLKLTVTGNAADDFTVKKIVINGPATIFFWKDGSKTIVKCMKGDKYDLYTAFCIALTKKLLGSNSKIKSTLKKAEIVDQNDKTATGEVEKEIAEVIDRIKKGLNRQINSTKI